MQIKHNVWLLSPRKGRSITGDVCNLQRFCAARDAAELLQAFSTSSFQPIGQITNYFRKDIICCSQLFIYVGFIPKLTIFLIFYRHRSFSSAKQRKNNILALFYYSMLNLYIMTPR